MISWSILKFTNHTRKTIKCSFCDYETRYTTHLRRHTDLIHGDKIECDLCDKQFTRQDSLDRHRQVIHGPRLECQECDKKFVRQGSLQNHVKLHHRRERLFTREGHMLMCSTEKVTKNIKYYFCQYCDYKTSRRRNFKGHKLCKHTVTTHLQGIVPSRLIFPNVSSSWKVR